MAAWGSVIGLEVHARLETRTKLFCSCPNSAGGRPNSRLCPVCLGLPGALPAVNREAVRLGVRLALALGCCLERRCCWARKSYFYPDLPKGYQITQYQRPLAIGGKVRIDLPETGSRWIGIERVHLEEDAGKSLHGVLEGSSTGVDLNRCGVPLVEIVSAPELTTPVEAAAFARRLRAVLRTTGVSRAEMERGSLRCDANVSLTCPGRPPSPRTEIKNLNSFRHLRRALEAEIARQRKIVEAGGQVRSETRGWDDRRRRTVRLRAKEVAAEYRYLPEPDLPDLQIDDALEQEALAGMPEPVHQRRDRYVADLGLSAEDAGRLTDDPRLVAYFEALVEGGVTPRLAANWLLSEVLAHASVSSLAPPAAQVARLLRALVEGRIRTHRAKALLAAAAAGEVCLAQALEQLPEAAARSPQQLERICRQVLVEHPRLVERYREGKSALLSFFVGRALQASGDADPRQVREVMERLLAAM